jgi:hypothetical protein
MLLAVATSDLAGRIAVGVVTFLITAGLTWFFNRRKVHRQLVQDVAERYIAERVDPPDNDSFPKRLASMQRAGVALFHNDKDVNRFVEIVVGRGCTHPFYESDLSRFLKKNKLPTFLRIANSRGIRFYDDGGLYEFLVYGYLDADESTSKKSSDNSQE